VDVPDFSKGRAGAVRRDAERDAGAGSAPRDLLADLMPIVPTTNRYFKQKTDQVRAFVRIYQPKGGLKPVALAVKVTDSSGTEVINRPVTIPVLAFGGDKQREAAYSFAVPLAALRQGSYLLTFQAVQGKDTARRDVRFVVQ
jgi:hypothetical protein